MNIFKELESPIEVAYQKPLDFEPLVVCHLLERLSQAFKLVSSLFISRLPRGSPAAYIIHAPDRRIATSDT
jgi:hypothetical protein